MSATRYVGFEHPEVREFKEAVERFRADIPNIVAHLRGMIVAQGGTNAAFGQRRDTFLALCRASINPAVTLDDVNEMLIQHILTEEIFLSIFSDTHRRGLAHSIERGQYLSKADVREGVIPSPVRFAPT